MYNLYVDR